MSKYNFRKNSTAVGSKREAREVPELSCFVAVRAYAVAKIHDTLEDPRRGAALTFYAANKLREAGEDMLAATSYQQLAAAAEALLADRDVPLVHYARFPLANLVTNIGKQVWPRQIKVADGLRVHCSEKGCELLKDLYARNAFSEKGTEWVARLVRYAVEVAMSCYGNPKNQPDMGKWPAEQQEFYRELAIVRAG